MDKRTILAVVLSLAVLFTYQMFFAKHPVPQKATAPVQESKQVSSDTAAKQPSSPLTVSAPKPAAKQTIAKKE